jgi:hypothetical protein
VDADHLADEAAYDSPEAVARADIPDRFVTILEVRIDGDSARVWSLTNDRARPTSRTSTSASGWTGAGIRAPAPAGSTSSRLKR